MKPLAVCAIFKNEARFLLEWIAYHHAIGFDRFVLYDNDSSDGGAALVRTSPLAGIATVVPWPQRPGQLAAYRHFIAHHAAGFEWAAFIDLDEFLLPLHGTRIADLLQCWPAFSAVLVHWRVFGPSGWIEPPDRLVIEAYDQRAPDDAPVNRHIKSIVRCRDLLDAADENPHEFRVAGPVCNTLGQAVRNTAIQPAACHEYLVLNHYITRSQADWQAKLQRGTAMFEGMEAAYEAGMLQHFAGLCTVRDTAIAAFAPRVRAMLALPAPADGGNVANPASGASPPMSDPVERQPPSVLNVASQLVALDAGMFWLALLPGPDDAASGLPAVRVCLPPGPPGRPAAASISTARGDGWLSSGDEACLLRVAPGGCEVLVTRYWATAGGVDPAPRLRFTRVGLEQSGAAIPQAASPGAEVVAHVQDVGDVEGRIGEWIGVPGSGRWIEGFSLTPPPGIPAEALEYRAVLGRDWLSPWLPAGRYCGSRGLALPLRGFSLRLLGAAAAGFSCSYAARFVDGSEIASAGAERVCVAATLAPLEAFQVHLRPRSG